jgi:hypothetical protein
MYENLGNYESELAAAAKRGREGMVTKGECSLSRQVDTKVLKRKLMCNRKNLSLRERREGQVLQS